MSTHLGGSLDCVFTHLMFFIFPLYKVDCSRVKRLSVNVSINHLFINFLSKVGGVQEALHLPTYHFP
jgi:hypothetical protein